MGCKMTKKSKKYTAAEEDTTTNNTSCPVDLDQMKRKDLQKTCKKLKLKAIGKNVELIARIQCYYNELELKEINENEGNKDDDIINKGDIINSKDDMLNNIDDILPTNNVEDLTSSPNKLLNEEETTTSPKDWNWVARWCVVDGVLKQDAKDRWVMLQLLGGRTVFIVDEESKAREDFVLEPTILQTPENCEDNYICGDCVRKNHKKLSNWIGISKTKLIETPKSSLVGKENCHNDNLLLRQSFKRKREEVLSPRYGSDFIEIVDSPMKVRRLNPRASYSPASPRVRRERGEHFQLPKNLLNPWKPKKTKNTPPKEDADFAQKVEEIITHLSPDEQLSLVFGAKKSSVMHSPQPKKDT